ncbi:MAG: metallophosphoesterase [Solirubrobacterales bacterium]
MGAGALRTLIVSDLHLGSAGRTDLLRRPELRETLLEQLREVDRVVLLGDLLELRHGPRREALAAARPFFEELGRVIGAPPAREVVVVAGNHDHALIEPWLERRSELPAPAPLRAEQRLEADAVSPMMAQLAEWAAPARLSAAYPGLWVRPDVYATHGHYLDCHITLPSLERLGIGAMGRMMRRPARSLAGAEDYEAVTVPVFAWIDAVARQAPTGDALNGGGSVRAWHALGGGDSTAAAHGEDRAPTRPGWRRNGYRRVEGLGRQLRTRTLAGGFTLAVGALNRAGLGPLSTDLSTGELRRAGLRAMGEVAARLDLGSAHVVFGHTHRAGPLPGDEASEWATPGGGRLVNTGCWTYDSYFLTSTPGESPYWPGGCVLVEDDGPPILRRLLESRGHAELAPTQAR